MGLQLRVTGLILILNTAVIVAFGVYNAQVNKAALTRTSAAVAYRELEDFSFRTARALIDRDDLALSDALQSRQGLSGFAFGAVYSAKTRGVIISRVENAFADQSKEIETASKILATANWETMVASGPIPKIPATKSPPDSFGKRLHYYHKAVFHPFVKVNPPLLAVVQIAVSDEFINKSIHDSQIEILCLCAGIFLFCVITGFSLSQLVIKLVRASGG